jgi:hypothetical protein
MVRRILSILGLMIVSTASAALAQDAVLYEVSEVVKFAPAGKFQSSNATLSGRVRSGTSVCPASLGVDACTLTVRATGRADDTTGIGPVNATFDVLVQDWNTADAAEVPIIKGTLNGTIDMSPAFLSRIPLGHISGQFKGEGVKGTIGDGVKAGGSFDGTFRLPFWAGHTASYMMDDGSITPVQAYEFALGVATVRLELNVTDTLKKH